MKVDKSMIIAEVLMAERGLAPIFSKHGLHCLSCAAATKETIEDAALIHHIDLADLLNDLNTYLINHQQS